MNDLKFNIEDLKCCGNCAMKEQKCNDKSICSKWQWDGLTDFTRRQILIEGLIWNKKYANFLKS
jgi:hypothetical protein